MNKIAFLTAKVGFKGEEFSKPRILTVPEDSIKDVRPLTKSQSEKYPGLVKGAVKANIIPGGKTAQVFETPAQIEVARDPNATNVNAADKALGLSAAGSTQGAGTNISAYFNEVDTATDGSAEALTLPAATVGAVHVVVNNTAVDLEVFPASGEIVNGGAADAQYDQAARSRAHYVCEVAGEWMVAV